MGVVEEEAVVASAPEESGAPDLTEEADWDFACFGWEVVDESKIGAWGKHWQLLLEG